MILKKGGLKYDKSFINIFVSLTTNIPKIQKNKTSHYFKIEKYDSYEYQQGNDWYPGNHSLMDVAWWSL